MTAFEDHGYGSGLRFPSFDVAPAGPKGRPLRYYVGRSAPCRCSEVWVVGARVEALAHRRRWSDAPFAWGDASAGAVELAAALLDDHIALPVPRELAGMLAEDLLEMLPGHGFVLTGDDLRLWLDIADYGRPRRGRRRPR